MGTTSGKPSIKLASRFSSGILGRGLVDRPRDGEPSRAKDEAMRAVVKGTSRTERSGGVLCHHGMEIQIKLAVDGGVANAQLSRGDDRGGRCFGVGSSDSAMRPASSANS